MTCLEDKIKETIKNDDLNYITNRDEIIIPVTKSMSLEQAITLAKTKIATVDGEFKPRDFASPVSMTVRKDGVSINIHPSKELVDFYEEDYKEEPARADTDNAGALIAFKEGQLQGIDKKIRDTNLELRYNDTKAVRDRLKKLEKAHDKLIKDINGLNTFESIYHAVIDDLEDIENDLKSDDIHDIDTIKNKLDWYQSQIINLDSDEITGKIAILNKRYTDLIRNKTVKILKEDTQVQNTLKNLNEKSSKEIELKDLLRASKDISKFQKNLSGLISSWTGNTVIPEWILNHVMKTKNKHENRILGITDRLEKFSKQHPDIDRNIFIAKDEDGELTGYLTDLYSPAWYKELKKRDTLLKNHYRLNNKGSYENIWNWHKKNSVVINFFRLPQVKEIYGEHPDFKDYFTYDDKSMQDYEDNLKSVLGPRYDDTVNSLLNKLIKFNEIKEEESKEDIARKNIWEFTRKYLAGDRSPMEGGNYLLTGFNDLTFVAKQTTKATRVLSDATIQEQEINTGFYSKEFQGIIRDKTLSELWDIYREMSDYISNTYGDINYGRLSYPKIEKTFAEHMLENLRGIRQFKFGKIGTAIHDVLHEWKSFYFEKGFNSEGSTSIIPNKLDRSSKQFRDLKQAYKLEGYTSDEAERLTNRALLSEYSSDMDRNFKASLLAAAFHNARVEVEPVSKMMLNYFKEIKDKNGNLRKNAVEQLEFYVNKIVLNQSNASRGSARFEGKDLDPNNGLAQILGHLQDSTAFGARFIRKHGLRLLSKPEKEIYEKYRKLRNGNYADNFGTIKDSIKGESYYFKIQNDSYYLSPNETVSKETFDKEYNKYIEKKLSSLGLNLNLAGLVDGIVRTSIAKGLAFSPTGGIFNRVEGMHTIMIMDLTGAYWTPGNSDVAKELMAFSNLSTYSKTLSRLGNPHSKQIDIFRQFLKRLGGLQDRKDDLQRSANKNTIFNPKIDAYKWAVTDPEFKNQGTVILSVLMDEKIKDNEGNEHSLLDKDTKEFTPFTINDEGILHIKPEFSNFNFESEQMQNLMVKASNAVSHSQGNYNPQDIMLIKRSYWGRALSTFKTWLPEALFQRYGFTEKDGDINVNLAFNSEQKRGRYSRAWGSSKGAAFAGIVSGLGLSFGLLGTVPLLGTGALTALVYHRILKNINNDENIKSSISTPLQLVTFLKSTLIQSLNYPSRLLSSIPGMKNLRIKDTSYTSEKFSVLSDDDIGALKSLSLELAISLVWLSAMLGIGSIMFDDDDEEKRMRYNFVQNQLSRTVKTLTSYSNPVAFINDQSRIGAVSFLENTYKLLKGIAFDHDFKKSEKSFEKLVPVPRDVFKLFKGIEPWEDQYNYSNFTFQGLGDMKWTQDLIKDIATKGESSAKKTWDDLRKEERENIMDDFGDITQSISVRRIIADNIIQERYGNKQKGKTYKETVETIDTSIDHKDREKLKNSLIRKLKAKGLSDKTIEKIVEKRFNEYD